MPYGISLTTSTAGRGAYLNAWRRIRATTRKDVADSFIDQTRRLANEFYNQTAAIAPSKAEISAEVKALGWHIPATFPDGRMGRGDSAMWLDKRKRGRPSKASQRARSAQVKRPSLSAMQRFVIERRSKHRLYLASGWLGSVEDLGGRLRATSGRVDRARGGATILRDGARVRITLWNRTPGIVEMDLKHNLISRAYAARTADMLAHVAESLAKAHREAAVRK